MGPLNPEHKLAENIRQWLGTVGRLNPALAKDAVSAPAEFVAQTALSHLSDLYRLTVLVVKVEADMDRVAHWWELMADVCESYHHALARSLGPQPALADMVKLRDRCREFRDLAPPWLIGGANSSGSSFACQFRFDVEGVAAATSPTPCP